MDKTKGKLISIMLLLIAISIILQPSFANASTNGAGNGGTVHNGQAGNWRHTYSDPWDGVNNTGAWNAFAAQNTYYSNISNLINSLDYPPLPGGERLADACKRSQYIWWYGGRSESRLFTLIGSNVHVNIPQSGTKSTEMFNDFLSSPYASKWGQPGGTVIVCSGVIEQNRDPNVHAKADSGRFQYNGNWHVINTGKETGYIKEGHYATAEYYGTRMEPGTSPVYVYSVDVFNNFGLNVTDEYKVTMETGRIIVDPNESKPRQRCDYVTTETVHEIVQNDANVVAGFLPSGAPGFAPLKTEYRNQAYYLSRYDSLPKVWDTRSQWNSWKSQFIAGGKDLKTNPINLESGPSGPAQIISKHGGVLNVSRTHHYYEVTATICQPMKEVCSTDSEGNVYCWWVKDGPERIQSLNHGDRGKKDFYSYQVLGVNCNEEGFQRAVNASDVEAIHSYGDGVASGLLETKEVSGLHFPLGSSGETATSEFYNEGPTCKETFENICVNDLLQTAEHDAKFNLEIEPFFTHEDDELYKDAAMKFPDLEKTEGHGFPTKVGEAGFNPIKENLVFFRDNKDRTVRADVWYPKETGISGLVTYPEKPADRTKTRLFEGATPDIDITTVEGADGTPAPMKEFEKNFINSGHINKFNMKSQWASDDGKPYELAIDWVYKADAFNNGPTQLDGYRLLATAEYEYKDFDAHCQFMNIEGEHNAQIPINPFLKQTLNGPFEWNEENSVKVLFSRSVSDRSN